MINLLDKVDINIAAMTAAVSVRMSIGSKVPGMIGNAWITSSDTATDNAINADIAGVLDSSAKNLNPENSANPQRKSQT